MLVMLALADWCNNDGLSLHPSMRAIAEKCRLSEVQARRVIHSLIHDGYLEVVGNHSGGAPGMSRHYRLCIERLTALTDDSRTGVTNESRTGLLDDSPTPLIDDRPLMGETALMGDRDGSHGRSETPLMGESLTTIEPSLTTMDIQPASRLKSVKAKKSTLPKNFCVSERVRVWAEKSGFGRLEEHLDAFRLTAQARGYAYVDWDAAFMKAIRDDWARLRVRRTDAPRDARFAN